MTLLNSLSILLMETHFFRFEISKFIYATKKYKNIYKKQSECTERNVTKLL